MQSVRLEKPHFPICKILTTIVTLFFILKLFLPLAFLLPLIQRSFIWTGKGNIAMDVIR